MAIDTLMVGGSLLNPAFGLEHAAAHQVMLEAIGNKDVQFASEPYYFDPRVAFAGKPASMWQVKHQNAHDEAAADLPPFHGSTAVGMNIGQILVDSDLEEPSGLTWSLFVNLQLHYAAMSSIGP